MDKSASNEVVDPVLPESHIEGSKRIFNDAMKASQGKPESVIGNVVGGEGDPPPPSKKEPEQTPPESKKPDDLPAEIFDPAKPDEVKPNEGIAEIEAMQLPKNAKPEQVANFDKIKKASIKHLSDAQSKIDDLQKKIEAAGKNTDVEALQKKLEAAEKKATEIEEQFGRAAYERSPKFQAQFVDTERAAIEDAKAYATGLELDPNLIDMAIHAAPKDRVKILTDGGADPQGIAAIVPHLSKYDDIQRAKSKALENWKVESQRHQEELTRTQQETATKRKEQEDKVWQDIAGKHDLLPYRKAKDNEQWNTRADELRARAKQIFNGEADLATVAEITFKGTAYDALNDVVTKLVESNKNLRQENANLKSSRPGGEMSVTGGAGDGKGKDTSKMSADERAKASFNDAMAAAGAR